jgi:hypothetical protein
MDPHDIEPIRAILHRVLFQYLDVTRDGLRLRGEERPMPVAVARILSFGGARTLYRQRSPSCRSLDGVVAITEPLRYCAECELRPACTPQVRLDLIVRGRGYRCLLAYTSAKNFLEYDARLRRDHITIDQVLTEINVVDRGSWGELRFDIAPPTPLY